MKTSIVGRINDIGANNGSHDMSVVLVYFFSKLVSICYEPSCVGRCVSLIFSSINLRL